MRQANQCRCVVEPLESRELLSASLPLEKVWDIPPAPSYIVRTVKPLAVAPKAPALPQIVGTWSGTTKDSATGQTAVVSMTITKQIGAGAIGTFNFGPITANTSVANTAVITSGNARGFQAVFQGKNFYGSINATISANEQQITGRWSCNGPTGWHTGTVVINLVPASLKKH